MDPARPLSQSDNAHIVVMIVDDEELVRRVAVMSLERDGYALLVAESGEAAVAISRTFPGTIDLILADLRMRKGIDGQHLRDKLFLERPGTPVLVMSGDTFSGRVPEGVQTILKPFSAPQLRERVRNLLCSRLTMGAG